VRKIRERAHSLHGGSLLRALRSLVVEVIESNIASGGVVLKMFLALVLVGLLLLIDSVILFKRLFRRLWRAFRFLLRNLRAVATACIETLTAQWSRVKKTSSEMGEALESVATRLTERLRERTNFLLDKGPAKNSEVPSEAWAELLQKVFQSSAVWLGSLVWALLVSTLIIACPVVLIVGIAMAL